MDPIASLKDFLRHPSVSTDPAYADGMEGAREHLRALFTEMDCDVEVVPTGGQPLVLAHRDAPTGSPHVLIYGHYDVQPPDPLDLWESPPFEPTERDGRLYARGAADNKGPMMVHIAAAAELIKENPQLPLRLTFLIEGEEEIGSPSLAPTLTKLKDRLEADFVLLSDTLSPSTEQIAITTGLRGITCFEFTLEGPHTDLHSGLYGGCLLNPLQAMMELGASLHHPDGTVNVPGFYDEVVPATDDERAEVDKIGNDPVALAASLGVAAFKTPPGFTPMQACRFLPTLEFNGLWGGYQGPGSKTIIPSKVSAKVSCRLVADQDPETIKRRVQKALRDRCPPQVKLTFKDDHDGRPYLVRPPHRDASAPDTPLRRAFAAAEEALAAEFGKPPVFPREGGSVPVIADIKTILGLDSLMIGMFTPQDRLHAPNEGFDLAMFRRGIAASKRLLAAVAGI